MNGKKAKELRRNAEFQSTEFGNLWDCPNPYSFSGYNLTTLGQRIPRVELRKGSTRNIYQELKTCM